MKNKIDLIIKLVIAAAIIAVLIILVLPAQKTRVTNSPTGNAPQQSAQRPEGGQKPAGVKPGSESRNASIPAQAVNVSTAVLGTVSDFIKVNGDVVADAEIEIYPDVSGKIVSSSLSVGDQVKKGQTVAVIDPSLPGQNFAESDVYSTISGTVLSVNVQVGSKVSTNTSIITVGDLRSLKLKTYIPEKYTGNIRTGLPAEVNFAAFPGRIFNAQINTISPVLDPASRTVEVELNFTTGAEKIKSGMFASIKLVTNQVNNVITIPATAVFSYYGEDTVFVVSDNNTVERRNVETGMSTVELVEITSGLAVGDTVVTEGQSLLKDGSTVKIANRNQE